jgi:hypothetical protein
MNSGNMDRTQIDGMNGLNPNLPYNPCYHTGSQQYTPVALFQQHNPPRLLILLRPQLDKIDTAGDGFADCVAPVPVRSAGSLSIDSGGLIAQIQPLDGAGLKPNASGQGF